MAAYWERAAHSIDRMFFRIMYTICDFSYFPFWFEGKIWVLITHASYWSFLTFYFHRIIIAQIFTPFLMNYIFK